MLRSGARVVPCCVARHGESASDCQSIPALLPRIHHRVRRRRAEPARPGDAKLHKHSVLAMVQRAGAEKASASVCVVEVPPVTTYHSDGGPAGKASPLVSHQAPPITRLGSGSYGHHRTPSFGHEHTHQQHEHSFPEPARIGVPRVASGDHAHSHRERGATPPMGTLAKPQKREDEESCCGCETGDHDHVHRGVMHKHIVVVGGVAPELTPLMPPSTRCCFPCTRS